MAWLAVITAGVLEVGFATMLKLSNNFTKTWPSIGFLIFASGSFSLLGATSHALNCYALNNYSPDLPHCPHSRTSLSLFHWQLAGNV